MIIRLLLFMTLAERTVIAIACVKRSEIVNR